MLELPRRYPRLGKEKAHRTFVQEWVTPANTENYTEKNTISAITNGGGNRTRYSYTFLDTLATGVCLITFSGNVREKRFTGKGPDPSNLAAGCLLSYD